MFRITQDPSSGSLVQCLAKNYKNDSIVSVDMDNVSVMAAYGRIILVILLLNGYYLYQQMHIRIAHLRQGCHTSKFGIF